MLCLLSGSEIPTVSLLASQLLYLLLASSPSAKFKMSQGEGAQEGWGPLPWGPCGGCGNSWSLSRAGQMCTQAGRFGFFVLGLSAARQGWGGELECLSI